MISKEFDAIAKADIDSLVANAVAERRTIEYKQQLPGGTDDDKKEFLADVSSFANAAGGHIIYGITEQRDENGKPTGIPELADGLAGINADAGKRRLEDIIRAGIDPRLPGLRINHYEGFSSGPVVLVRIPKSWVSPHMVIFNNLSRFFTRNSAGKQQLDVREIRAAFTASGDLRTKISAFHTERLAKIIANEGSVSLPDTPKLIFHLIPLTILDSAFQVDLAPLASNPILCAPIRCSYCNNRHNLDGFISYYTSRNGGNGAGYCQVFRSGVFEVVDTDISTQSDNGKSVSAGLVGKELIDSTVKYCDTAKQLGVLLPLIVMVTLNGLKGFSLATGSPWHESLYQIDRDTLLLPDVLLEDYSTPAHKLLRPVLDAFWQSAGFETCEHYNQQGSWDGGISKYKL